MCSFLLCNISGSTTFYFTCFLGQIQVCETKILYHFRESYFKIMNMKLLASLYVFYCHIFDLDVVFNKHKQDPLSSS